MFIYTIFLPVIISDCPDDKHLNKYVRGKVCAAGADKWRDLGIVLMGQDAVIDLDTIKVDYPYNVKECCSRMFTEWRQRTPKASWKQLIEALKEVKLTQLASELEELLIPSISQLPLKGTGIIIVRPGLDCFPLSVPAYNKTLLPQHSLLSLIYM